MDLLLALVSVCGVKSFNIKIQILQNVCVSFMLLQLRMLVCKSSLLKKPWKSRANFDITVIPDVFHICRQWKMFQCLNLKYYNIKDKAFVMKLHISVLRMY